VVRAWIGCLGVSGRRGASRCAPAARSPSSPHRNFVPAQRAGAGRVAHQDQRVVALGRAGAAVTHTLTIKPWRFSASRWPRYASTLFCPTAFLCNWASGSVVETCVAFDRFSPRKFTVGFPGSSGGSPGAGITAFETFQARPRFQLRPVDGEVLVRQQLRRRRVLHHRIEKRGRNVAARNRSRFLLNIVGTQTGSSIPKPTNQRNSRLYCSCSINFVSLRIV